MLESTDGAYRILAENLGLVGDEDFGGGAAPILICDTREDAVTTYTAELSKVKKLTKQMTVGDFAVIVGGKIWAILERKTFDDYSASIKDGRHQNKEKMLALAAETGCQVYYIVEGAFEVTCTDGFGGITYSMIESSMFHLMQRDGIHTIRTRSAYDTARMLVRFVKSMGNLNKKILAEKRAAGRVAKAATTTEGQAVKAATTIETLITKTEGQADTLTETPTETPNEKVITTAATLSPSGGSEPTDTAAIINELTKPRRIPLPEAVRKAWTNLPGIGPATAEALVKNYTLSDFVENRITQTSATAALTSFGLIVKKPIITTLSSAPTQDNVIKVLAGVNGVSKKMAELIYSTHGPAFPSADLSEMIYSGRKIKKVGASIKEFFSYSERST